MLSVDLQRLIGTIATVFGFQPGEFSIPCWNLGIAFRTKIVDLNREVVSTPKKTAPSTSNTLALWFQMCILTGYRLLRLSCTPHDSEQAWYH